MKEEEKEEEEEEEEEEGGECTRELRYYIRARGLWRRVETFEFSTLLRMKVFISRLARATRALVHWPRDVETGSDLVSPELDR